MISTYEEAVEYLKSFIPFTLYQTDAYQKKELKDPLDRMRYLLTLLDNPEKKFHSVLIGGTSGKGSTSYLISHMLTTARYKTGLTLSPHLVRINERIQINDTPISDTDFLMLIQRVELVIDQMKKSAYGVPSYFEITIAMAFLYFVIQKVDIAVVEVGMGGEHDATNTLEPLVSVLTNVSLDHTQFLGDTVEKIATAKVGIIKKYQVSAPIVVTGVTQPSVIDIVEKKSREVGAKLLRLNKDFPYFPNLPHHPNLPMEKVAYQKDNLSLAIETVKQLYQFGFLVTDSQITEALQTAAFPGRFEKVNYELGTKNYELVLDGAHNPAKMQAFITSLQKAYPKKKKIFVLAFKKDKNIEDMLKEILPVADAIVATEFSIGTDTMISNASYEVDDLTSLIEKNVLSTEIYSEKDAVKAVEKAVSLADADTIIAITGSLYLVGEVKQRLFSD